MYNGLPLYLKTYVDTEKNVLISLLTDIRSSVWLEYFGDARALFFRIKVSSRETPKSTYTDLKEKEAVPQLLSALEAFPDVQDGQTSLEAKSDSEVELVLPLSGIQFRLRLDKVSPEAQALLLYDLVYLPLLGIVNAVQQATEGGLRAIQHGIDQQSKSASVSADSEILSAMQRFSQGVSGIPVGSRVPIATLVGDVRGSTSRTTPSPKKSSSRTRAAKPSESHPEDRPEKSGDDGDKTMLSSPEPELPKSTRSSRTMRQDTTSPAIARNTRAVTKDVPSPSPSPPLSSKSRKKGKARHIAESPEDDGDSDATQDSEGEQAMDVDKQAHEKPRKPRKVTDEEASPNNGQTPSQAEASPPPASPRKKTKASTPPKESTREASHPPSSPHGPILKRPTASATRGMPPRRGKKPGMQWSNFG